ncbi:MAG: putative porin [Halioglobus sp.]
MKKIITLVVWGALCASTGANAQVPAAEWEQFKAEFAAMSERVKALETENQKLRAAAGGNTVKVEDLAATNAEVATLKQQTQEMSWAEKIKWKGDYRFRYEDIDQEGRDDRERYRIRARPALVAKTSDTTEVGFGLATGSDDPVSSNQTLGGGSTSKQINLDLAYATWTGLEDTAVTAGKFVNPFYTVEKSQLIFDGDFRPEGAAVSWANDMFFANATYSFIESDSNQSDKNNYGVWATQLGATFTPVDGAKLTVSAGYIDIPVKGEPAIYNNSFYGNSSVLVDGVDVYEYNYELVTASVDLGFTVFDQPLNVFADYVENRDVNDLETGYLAGVQLGSAKTKGGWQVKYQYEALDANASLGLVTDSDFAGGGTDVKGNTFSATYAIDNNWYVATTYYFDNKVGVNLGDDANYDRIQLDTGFKY